MVPPPPISHKPTKRRFLYLPRQSIVYVSYFPFLCCKHRSENPWKEWKQLLSTFWYTGIYKMSNKYYSRNRKQTSLYLIFLFSKPGKNLCFDFLLGSRNCLWPTDLKNCFFYNFSEFSSRLTAYRRHRFSYLSPVWCVCRLRKFP